MKEELIFCPLGGSGEIGMNMNLFAYGKAENQKWIIVDIGVTFADDTVPGVDLIYPDPGFIVDKKDDLLGIVLTHAHEDHIGAIAHIWPKLKCKIFATPFTAVLINEKFKEKKIEYEITTVDKTTEGAVSTTLLCRDKLDKKNPLIVKDCDQILNWNINNFLNFVKRKKADGVIVTLPTINPGFSFVKLDDDQSTVLETKEKQVISSFGNTGFYFFSKTFQKLSVMN